MGIETQTPHLRIQVPPIGNDDTQHQKQQFQNHDTTMPKTHSLSISISTELRTEPNLARKPKTTVHTY